MSEPESAVEELTVEELKAATEKRVILPMTSKVLGRERGLTVHRIGVTAYLALLPPPPPESTSWPREEATQRELAWLEGLSPEARAQRQGQLRDVAYQVVALASRLTVDEARALGDEADVVARAVMDFSGFKILSPAPATTTTDAVNTAPAEEMTAAS